jgi:hypothetical protein
LLSSGGEVTKLLGERQELATNGILALNDRTGKVDGA